MRMRRGLDANYKLANVFTLRRLEELNRQIGVSAKRIEYHELRNDLLKRDIVFCTSLYLKNNITVQENEIDPDCYNCMCCSNAPTIIRCKRPR